MNEHSHSKATRHLGIVLGITASFFIVELVGGFLTNSLVLLTDAWHMLNDVSALAFALAAAWVANRPTNIRKTYGYYRAEILAALLNGIFLWAVVIFIFFEAFQRIQQPSEVKTLEMLTIAVFGFAANGISALILSGSKQESLNIKGALLHIFADMLGSVGAISAGVIMYFTGWYQTDPLISIMLGVLIFYSSARLIQDSLNVLLEGVPSHIELEAVERRITELEGVQSVHDLHVWCITPSKMCIMSAHVVLKKKVNRKKLISTLISMLKEEFGIDHVTIQLEDEGYPKAVSEH